MRIPGLATYIKTKELRPALLSDRSVVIDGQNFLFNVYEEKKINFELGCETDRLRECIRSHLDMFSRAKVKCYFVFKGGDQNIERKIEKLKNVKDTTEFNLIGNKSFVPPILMKDSYKQILDEMAIDYTVCQFESKRDCVALAETMNCPVISDDIEFCFLQAVYIDSSTLKYNNAKKAIQCKQYVLKDFLAKHSLTQEKLAIFVVLTDIYIFPKNFFNDLFKWLKIIDTDLHNIYTKLWQWLARLNAPTALDNIKRFLSDDDRLRFMDRMYEVVDFMKLKRTSYVVDYLNKRNLNVRPADPHWFEKGVVSKRIAIPYINLYYYNYWLETLGIETKHSDPSQLVAADILKYAYNLLTNFKRDKFMLVINSKEEIPISVSVSDVESNERHPFEDGWDGIKEKRYFERFLTANSIDVSLISQIERSEAALLIIALVYYARKKSVSVSREARAVIICYVIMDTSASYSDNDLDRAVKATKFYFNATKSEIYSILNKDVLYRLAEYQHCLRHLNYLNALCGAPLVPTTYPRAYSGTAVYKLFKELAGRGDSFVPELLRDYPSVLRVVTHLINSYEKLLNA